MSGYNRFEQAIGTVLDRFPRTKSVVETTYQRLNYHVANRRDFRYQLRDDVELRSVEKEFGIEPADCTRFVGFYDVCPWSTDADSFLLHELHGDTATIVAVSDGTVRTLGTAAAWNYQQGSRLQWHPAQNQWLVFNDTEHQREVARVFSLDGDRITSYPQPVHAMHPAGTAYLSTNFLRADRNAPGYGYGTLGESDLKTPTDDGIVRVSLPDPANGSACQQELCVSLSELIETADTTVPQENHYIHHVLYAPDGDRFVFLHRWIDHGARHTRLCVSDTLGTVDCLLENHYISHFCWLDQERLFLWGGTDTGGPGYYILNTTTGDSAPVEALAGQSDGHPSLSPDRRWIVTDTYPDRARRRSLLLYNLETNERVGLGEFLAPFGYDGPTRCDLHPRWSPDGTRIAIDSTCTGIRRSYVVDVESIVK